MHATDKSLSPYSVTLRYCLHLIGQFFFFHNGTSNLKLTVIHTQVCMVPSLRYVYHRWCTCRSQSYTYLYNVFVFCVAVWSSPIASHVSFIMCYPFGLAVTTSLFVCTHHDLHCICMYVGLLCVLNILSWCSLCMWCLHFTLPEASEWPQCGEPSAAHHPLVTERSNQELFEGFCH